MDTEARPDAEASVRDRILRAALPSVPFDGWSETTFRAAIARTDVAPGLAHALFPRGGLDLALAYHRAGDAAMTEKLAATDLSAMRYSDRVAFAIRTRLDVTDRELVRRGTTLLTLPQHAAEGAKAIWGTADAIWKALGDTSTDFNWYSKRATLSGVYTATVLFWLGDDSHGGTETQDFISRRIDNVMRIEKVKASIRDNPVTNALRKSPFSAAFNAFEKIRMPQKPNQSDDLPGRTKT